MENYEKMLSITLDSKLTLEQKKSELCKLCQFCCTYISLDTVYCKRFMKEGYEPNLELLKTRGLTEFYIDDVTGCLVIEAKFPCTHLTPDGCDIYETRPDSCRNYDGIRDGRGSFKKKCYWQFLT